MGRAPWWLPWSVYTPLGALGASVAWVRHGRVFSAPSHVLSPSRDHAFALGVTFALALTATTLVSTRWLIRHTMWARTLATTLRAALVGASHPRIVLLALLSSLSEELFFRAALLPWLGLFVSSLVFGALHVGSRGALLPWMLWATLMGLAFALLYVGSGSLWPPILAHASINYGNMRYLARHDTNAFALPHDAAASSRGAFTRRERT